MSNGVVDQKPEMKPLVTAANGNGVVAVTHRLRLNPNTDHKPDNYEDLKLDFNHFLFSSLERYLPPSLINESREKKVEYMRDILMRYSPQGERNRVSVVLYCVCFLVV